MASFTCDRLPVMCSAGTTENTINLNPFRDYTIYHTSVTTTGGASTGVVFANMQDAAVTTTYGTSTGSGKVAIVSGGSFPVPPKTAVIRVKTASGSVALNVFASQSGNPD